MSENGKGVKNRYKTTILLIWLWLFIMQYFNIGTIEDLIFVVGTMIMILALNN